MPWKMNVYFLRGIWIPWWTTTWSLWSYLYLLHRGENGELRVGVRRLMRQLNNMPSSVISSHSMHLGVLATASHAIATGTLFSVFYKPRFAISTLHFFALWYASPFLSLSKIIILLWVIGFCILTLSVSCSLLPLVFDLSPTTSKLLNILPYDRTSRSTFLVSLNKYLEAQNHKLSVGMRFKMRFEGEEVPERR